MKTAVLSLKSACLECMERLSVRTTMTLQVGSAYRYELAVIITGMHSWQFCLRTELSKPSRDATDDEWKNWIAATQEGCHRDSITQNIEFHQSSYHLKSVLLINVPAEDSV